MIHRRNKKTKYEVYSERLSYRTRITINTRSPPRKQARRQRHPEFGSWQLGVAVVSCQHADQTITLWSAQVLSSLVGGDNLTVGVRRLSFPFSILFFFFAVYLSLST